jgi:hypothetical protein
MANAGCIASKILSVEQVSIIRESDSTYEVLPGNLEAYIRPRLMSLSQVLFTVTKYRFFDPGSDDPHTSGVSAGPRHPENCKKAVYIHI